MAKINKSKQYFRYAGDPKSYWEFAKRKAKRWVPKNQKESDFDKQKRLEREKYIQDLERQIKERRKMERKK